MLGRCYNCGDTAGVARSASAMRQRYFFALLSVFIFLIVGAASAASHGSEVTAFYVPWDQASLASLSDHRGQIDVVSPQWILLTNPQGDLTIIPDAAADERLHGFSPRLRVLPLVANVHDGSWDQAAAAALIGDKAVRDRTVARLVALAAEKHFDGYILDLENLDDASVAALPDFIRRLMVSFHAAKLELWICVPVGPEIWPLTAMQQAGAGLLFMAYDQCWDSSTPGPVAGVDWLAAVLPVRLRQLDRDKIIIALAGYGYDWPKGGRGHSITSAEAMQLARDHHAVLRRGRGSDNVTFTYQTDEGESHTVWLVDSYSYAVSNALLRKLGVHRIALWRLGSEDPDMWKAGKSPANHLAPAPAPLQCEPLQEN